MTPDHHLIRTTSVNFRFNGNISGLDLQEEVAAWCRGFLGPAIDSVLKDYDDLEEVISIDELKLDINLGNASDWQKELGERLFHQLREKIQAKIALQKEDIVIKSKSASFYEILAYFLKFGLFPWNADLKSMHDFKDELLKWSDSSSSSELKKLLAEHQDSRSIKRITSLLDEDVFEIFISKITKENRETIAVIFKDISAIISSLATDRQMQQNFFRDLKEKLIKYAAEAPSEKIIAFAVEEWMEEIMEHHPVNPEKMDLSSISTVEMKMIIRELKKNIQLSSGQKPLKSGKSKRKSHFPIEKEAEKIKEELDKELKEGFYVNNAGAVIIASFLPMLFFRTGITADNRILDEATALAMVNYCITGRNEAAEFELLLPKVLCGIAPESIIEIDPLTDENAIREADEMLKSVIEHWSVLKETSIDGLRESFLQRNGKLVFSGEEWLLFVEKNTYDMLLEHLPWNIQMIKLPWMKNRLTTIWI
jgi:hypothetical protein